MRNSMSFASARALDLEVIAEGVETVEQVRHLRNLESDHVQGYYFARPLPSDVAAAFLAEEHDGWGSANVGGDRPPGAAYGGSRVLQFLLVVL